MIVYIKLNQKKLSNMLIYKFIIYKFLILRNDDTLNICIP